MTSSLNNDVAALIPLFDIPSIPSWTFYREMFRDTLAYEAEFSFAPYKKALEITIEGKGEDFHQRILQYLHHLALPFGQIDAYSSINSLFTGAGTLVKTDFQQGCSPGVSLYYQTPLSIEQGSQIAGMLGLPSFPGEAFSSIGKALGRRRIFIGIDLDMEKAPAMAVFFLIPPRACTGLLDGLRKSMEILGLEERCREILADLHPGLVSLIRGDLFISFLCGTDLAPMIKIDYDRIPAVAAVRTLRALGLEEDEIRRLAKVAVAFDTSVLNYFGIKYHKEKPPGFKFYFKRHYRDGEAGERLAQFLESTIWRVS